MPAESNRLIVERVYERHKGQKPIQSALIPVLQGVQHELGYIPEEALERVSQLLGLAMGYSLEEMQYGSHRVKDPGFEEKVRKITGS